MVSVRWVFACLVLSVGLTGCTADRSGIAPDDGGGTGGDSGTGGTGGDAGLSCPTTPCENSGVCLSNLCDCADTGYAGDFCQTDIDECLDSNSCMNGGECLNSLGGFTCNCEEIDFNGDNCENMIDDCAGIDCMNGGSCVDGNRESACNCMGMWTNDPTTDLCTVPVVDCSTPGACVNGSCNDSSGSVVCTCDAGWQGSSCNVADDCGTPPGPPANATLMVNGTGFTDTADYQCNPGYDGDTEVLTCGDDEIWSPAAPSLSCTLKDCGDPGAIANGSVDTGGGTTFGSTATYSCDSGYSLSGSATRTCNAVAVWTPAAPTCVEIADCAPNPCMNGGTCTEDPGPGNFTCNCPAAWTGTNCETDVNECGGGLGPCSATGASACNNISGSYTCTCNTGYTGMDCDACDTGYVPVGATCVLDPCVTDPCDNAGPGESCDGSSGTAVCQCEVGYADGNANCTTCDTGFVDSMVSPGTCIDDPCNPDPCPPTAFCFRDMADQPQCSENCTDTVMNQDETGVDCGGVCLLCDGDPCAANAECVSGICDIGGTDTCIP